MKLHSKTTILLVVVWQNNGLHALNNWGRRSAIACEAEGNILARIFDCVYFEGFHGRPWYRYSNHKWPSYVRKKDPLTVKRMPDKIKQWFGRSFSVDYLLFEIRKPRSRVFVFVLWEWRPGLRSSFSRVLVLEVCRTPFTYELLKNDLALHEFL